jgi:2,4-dienoyl-CoA reductase-like NADH-dependent reductase (Old Yellow Enzyme family)
MKGLFDEAWIGTLKLRNRIIRSATREMLASPQGRVTSQYLDLYRRLAEGGAGLIIPGSFYVNEAGRPSSRIILLDRREIIDDLRTLTETVRERGAAIVAQLNHAGRQASQQVLGSRPLAPSAVRDRRSFVRPIAMTRRQIEDTIAEFGRAAGIAKEAGFNGVQIHSAHGYLVSEFLSAYTNRRKDEWGGGLEERMRFLLEIYKSVRGAVGNEFPVLVKINCEDFVTGGITLDQALSACRKLDEMGIDAIEVSGGIGEKGMTTIRGDIPRDIMMRGRSLAGRLMVRLMERSLREEARFTEAYFLPQAAAIKKAVKSPVIAVGGMRLLKTMEDALSKDKADFISLCRPFIREPDLPRRLEAGQVAVACNRCNRCSLEVLIHQNPLRCYRAADPEP